MEPAPELVTLVDKMLAGVSTSTLLESSSEHNFEWASRQPGLRVIGPDPDEWVTGFDTFHTLFSVQAAEVRALGGMRWERDEAIGWKEGSVGWVAWRGRTVLGESEPLASTMSIVLHEEGPYWKVVHWHFAFSSTNEDALGMELTTAVDELLLSMKDGDLPPAGMSADGSVTIVFTDVEDSTVLMESLGEPRWLDLLRWQSTIVTKQSNAFGGTVVKGQGDGFMLAFPAAGSAVACASAIQRAADSRWNGIPVPIRVGMHCGNASAEGGDFFGRTVVVAARIASAARGGEILASDSVQERLEGAFALDGARSLALKGLSGDFVAYPVLWK